MKTCPICNASCYDDMSTCFSCMHNFGESDACIQGAHALSADDSLLPVGMQDPGGTPFVPGPAVGHPRGRGEWAGNGRRHDGVAQAETGDVGDAATQRLHWLKNMEALDAGQSDDAAVEVAEPPVRFEIPLIDDSIAPFASCLMPKRMSGRETLRRRGSAHAGSSSGGAFALRAPAVTPATNEPSVESEARYQLVVKLQPVV